MQPTQRDVDVIVVVCTAAAQRRRKARRAMQQRLHFPAMGLAATAAQVTGVTDEMLRVAAATRRGVTCALTPDSPYCRRGQTRPTWQYASPTQWPHKPSPTASPPNAAMKK